MSENTIKKPILESAQEVLYGMEAQREWILGRAKALVADFKLWRRQTLAIEKASDEGAGVFLHLYLATTSPGKTSTGNPVAFTLRWERFLVNSNKRLPYRKGKRSRYRTDLLCLPFAEKRPCWVAGINIFEDRAAAIRELWMANQDVRKEQADFLRKLQKVLDA